MENINLPIYRAKKINSEDYTEGMLRKLYVDIVRYYLEDEEYGCNEIDKTTLAISFDNGKSFIKLSDLEIHTCTDFKLKYSDMKMRDKKVIQPPNGSIFTIIADKGR